MCASLLILVITVRTVDAKDFHRHGLVAAVQSAVLQHSPLSGKENNMFKYQVRFEYPDKLTRRLKRGVRHVNARDSRDAIAKVRVLMPLSSGHWINVQATESVK